MSDIENETARLDDTVESLQEGASTLFGCKKARSCAKNLCSRLCGLRGDTADTVRDLTVDQPLLAVVSASLIGLIIGALIRRRK